jgi:phage terminase large subunit-like protein
LTVQNAFKRLRLNIWTGSEEKWISDEDWAKGNGEIPDLTGRTCYGGLDLASTSDTAALVLIFPIEGIYYIKPFVFVPERQIAERDKRNSAFYFKWASEGFMIRTPGNVIDYRYIRDTLLECKKKYNIVSIGYDPYNALQVVTQWVQDYELTMEEYRQGWQTMSEPTKEFERLLMDGKVIHGGHPVLRWMADNAMCIRDNNDNYRVAKGKVSKDKVDGIVAAIMAMGEAIRFREQESDIYVSSW